MVYYCIGYASSARAKCEGPSPCAGTPINKGEMRVGTMVEISGHQAFQWWHWGCVTPKFLSNIKGFAKTSSNLDGYGDLKPKDKAKVDKAWKKRKVAPEDIPESAKKPQTDDAEAVTSSLDIATSSSSTSTKATAIIHPRYYVKDDLSVFLVNDKILFRIHRYFLDRESAQFRSFPTGTDDNPVELRDVDPDEFAALLEYFYDCVHGDPLRSREEWTQLLSISHKFGIEKVHNRAVKELQAIELGPVDKVVLAAEYDVDAWLEPAYVELCVRKNPIQEEEAQRLGLRTTVKLAHVREKFREGGDVQCSTSLVIEEQPSLHGYSPRSSLIPCDQSTQAPTQKEETAGIKRARQVVAEVFWPAVKKRRVQNEVQEVESTTRHLPGNKNFRVS